MSKTILLAASAALALVTAGSGVLAGGVRPSVSVKHQPKHTIVFPEPGSSVLYDQLDNDNGVGIVTQNFESSFDAYDSEAADDFTVPAGQTWKVKKILVDGVYFNGSGPVASENVAFYRDEGGQPGVMEGDPIPGVDPMCLPDCVPGGIILPKPKKLKGGKHGTTYWLSVQVNMDFSCCGEFGFLTNNTVRGNPSVWRNPGDGFATGCTDFAATTTCIPSGEGGDFAFTLLGKAKIKSAIKH